MDSGPLKVIFDLFCTQDPLHAERGVPTYTRELALAIERRDPDAVSSYLLDPDAPFPAALAPLLATGKIIKATHLHTDRDAVVQLTYPFDERLDPVALLNDHHGPRAVILYDLIPYLFPEQYLRTRAERARYRSRLELVLASELILCISEATARDARELLGADSSRVRVIGAGVSEAFRPAEDREAAFATAQRSVPALRPGFMLNTGGLDHRKNIEGLFAAYAKLTPALRSEHQLVVVCRLSPGGEAHLAAIAAGLGISDDILLTGYLDDPSLLSLYQSARLFVFPSIYEGFGLPVAESLACGTPAVVGDNSSLVEIVDNAAARFDAADPEATASVIERGLTDESLRSELLEAARRRPFRWDDVADRTIAAYAELGERRRAPAATPRTRRRPRIALVTPMPPAPSGVADYSARILVELSTLAEVHVFTQADAERTSIEGVAWAQYEALPVIDSALGGFDDIVFCVGNSYMHLPILSLLERMGRGTALMHDVHLQGVYSIQPESRSAYVRETIAARIAGELPPEHAAYLAQVNDYFLINRPLVRDVARNVDRILVHSRTAASIAAFELEPDQASKISVIPFGHPAVTSTSEHSRDVILSAGLVHVAKQSPKVIRTFAILAEEFPDLTFAVIGEDHLTPAQREDAYNGLAQPPANVVLGGRVEPEEFRAWFDRAIVAVQLRESAKGETSAAIADSLAAGVPIIASAVGSALELGSAVSLVRRDISPTELAAVIRGLLENPALREQLVTAGRAYADGNRFADAAAAILAPFV